MCRGLDLPRTRRLTVAGVDSHPASQLDEQAVPITCTLTADGYTDRIAGWRRILDGTVREVLPSGAIRVRVPVDSGAELAGLVAAESRCCPFFTFRLTFTATGVELEASAPADAASLLNTLLTHRPD